MPCLIAGGLSHSIGYMHLHLKRTLKAAFYTGFCAVLGWAFRGMPPVLPACVRQTSVSEMDLLEPSCFQEEPGKKTWSRVLQSSLMQGVPCAGLTVPAVYRGWQNKRETTTSCYELPEVFCGKCAQLKNVFGLCWFDSHKYRSKRELLNKAG